MWQEHVSNLSRSKSLSLAVNTFYLFHRLFLVRKTEEREREETKAITKRRGEREEERRREIKRRGRDRDS